MARSLRRKRLFVSLAADADGDFRRGVVAGVRKRGEFAAGAIGGTAARDGGSDGAWREPLAAGAATIDSEPGAVSCGRRTGDANYDVGSRDVRLVHPADKYSHLYGRARGPRGAARDADCVSDDRRDFRDFAGAALVKLGAGGGTEG